MTKIRKITLVATEVINDDDEVQPTTYEVQVEENDGVRNKERFIQSSSFQESLQVFLNNTR